VADLQDVIADGRVEATDMEIDSPGADEVREVGAGTELRTINRIAFFIAGFRSSQAVTTSRRSGLISVVWVARPPMSFPVSTRLVEASLFG
jgi:hypothetical protein